LEINQSTMHGQPIIKNGREIWSTRSSSVAPLFNDVCKGQGYE